MKVFTNNCNIKVILYLVVLIHFTLSAQVVNYIPSTNVIANPERGLQKYSKTVSDYSTTPGANNLSVATLNSWKNSSDKVTVIYRIFMLDAFIKSDINSTFIDNMQVDFDNIRTAGLKVIVRFAYSEVMDGLPQQPSMVQILNQISQLSPILTNNKDVIFSFQSGFIGTWGEWYHTNSSEFGSEGVISDTQYSNRKQVVDAMLSSVPVEIPIQLRTPNYKIQMYGNTPLTESTAYQNTSIARLGFFNDSFLNNWGDLGTFAVGGICVNPVGTTEYNYLSNETKYLPMSGETSGLNLCDSGIRTQGDNAIYEMGLSNWTTINRDYHLSFWNGVIASNHYDEIIKRLGYRFVINSSEVTVSASGFDLSLNISNEGFARPFKHRNVYLVLKNTQDESISTHLLNTDVRIWESTLSITQSFNITALGTYQLYLWMPDKETSLQGNSDYSIQLANDGLWDSLTGYNDLKQTVIIDSTAPSSPDTLYIMRDGSILNQFNINTEIDSIIFYSPN